MREISTMGLDTLLQDSCFITTLVLRLFAIVRANPWEMGKSWVAYDSDRRLHGRASVGKGIFSLTEVGFLRPLRQIRCTAPITLPQVRSLPMDKTALRSPIWGFKTTLRIPRWHPLPLIQRCPRSLWTPPRTQTLYVRLRRPRHQEGMVPSAPKKMFARSLENRSPYHFLQPWELLYPWFLPALS